MRLNAFGEERKGARSFNAVEEGLVKKSYEAMNILNIPNEESTIGPYSPQSNDFLFLIGINQEEIYNIDIKRMMEECPQNEVGHSTRVALIGMEITKLLEFGQDARITNWILDLSHDEAKLKLKKYYPENIPYKKGSKMYDRCLGKFMRGHVAAKNISLEWGSKMIASAIEQHHKHQQNSYPSRLRFPNTEESYFLSEITAVPDFLDAISSRPSKNTGQYTSPEEIMTIAMKEYAELRIKYSGNLFPKVDISGRELITELQKTGFVARERPANISEGDFRMNPFIGLEIK